MAERKKRDTAAVVVGIKYHEAMDLYFEKNGVPKKYQVEMALLEYFREKAPNLYKKLKGKEKDDEKKS